MSEFGESSKKALSSSHPKLRELFEAIVKTYDCKVLCGFRNEADQEKAFESGFSKVQWPNSKHNSYPSLAVDVVPWPLDWKDEKRFCHFAGYVQAKAESMGIRLRWGGNFDGDKSMRNDAFVDLPHYELLPETAKEGN